MNNDGNLDVYVACDGENRLLLGSGQGTFDDITAAAGAGGGEQSSRAALLLDSDHDADLDIFICNAPAAGGGATPDVANRLLNNNADGTFTDITEQAGVACPGEGAVAMTAADVDGDRDTDLVLLSSDRAVRVFTNELLASFRAVDTGIAPTVAARFGGALQDLTGDGIPDLVTLDPDVGGTAKLRLFAGDGRRKFAATAEAVVPALDGTALGLRLADVDLDGDLDVAVIGATGTRIAYADGRGRLELASSAGDAWKPPADGSVVAAEVLDWTGDGVADLLRVVAAGDGARVELLPGELQPAANWLAITPTGRRLADPRMRSPDSGYGVRITVRAGRHEQAMTYSGVNGSASQSRVPLTFGLATAKSAAYVDCLWPDGVRQYELAIAAGENHVLTETQRKISSCPVLFTYDGERFRFVTDFAGVGGLGYFVGPGESAPPQVLEHVKIESDQLQPRDGRYELRVAEPMEEAAYIDRLELRAVDHPGSVQVYPDECLAIGGPAPSHELLAYERPIFAIAARGPDGSDCSDAIATVDRRYAYDPPPDRHLSGFCRPHSIELDFGDRLAGRADDAPVHLYIHGYIEYPYSQTNWAASQSKLEWEALRVDRRRDDGSWETIVPDAGVPGGMARTMTVDLTGKVGGSRCTLRITTNLEVSYDRIFVAFDRKQDDLAIRTVPLVGASLRRLGFPREHSADGRRPKTWDYDRIDFIAPFHVQRGAYTRYGEVGELLAEYDDRFAILAPGDEIALSFDANTLPKLPAGWRRSFVLVSHAYCKDMDIYTAEPNRVEPLPFRGMSRYPYPDSESYPDDEAHRKYREEYNTRWRH